MRPRVAEFAFDAGPVAQWRDADAGGGVQGSQVFHKPNIGAARRAHRLPVRGVVVHILHHMYRHVWRVAR